MSFWAQETVFSLFKMFYSLLKDQFVTKTITDRFMDNENSCSLQFLMCVNKDKNKLKVYSGNKISLSICLGIHKGHIKTRNVKTEAAEVDYANV